MKHVYRMSGPVAAFYDVTDARPQGGGVGGETDLIRYSALPLLTFCHVQTGLRIP